MIEFEIGLYVEFEIGLWLKLKLMIMIELNWIGFSLNIDDYVSIDC